MKTFNRTSLPQSVAYNNKTYVRGEQHTNSIKVLVLSAKLKGKTDLHGKPYKPSIFYFNAV